jgi:hypothetical protein
MSPYVNLNAVAGQLYGTGSRLHTRRLQDRLRGTVSFQNGNWSDSKSSNASASAVSENRILRKKPCWHGLSLPLRQQSAFFQRFPVVFRLVLFLEANHPRPLLEGRRGTHGYGVLQFNPGRDLRNRGRFRCDGGCSVWGTIHISVRYFTGRKCYGICLPRRVHHRTR